MTNGKRALGGRGGGKRFIKTVSETKNEKGFFAERTVTTVTESQKKTALEERKYLKNWGGALRF